MRDINEVISDLSTGNTTVITAVDELLSPDADTRKGRLVDKVLQLVNRGNLLDFYVGVDYGETPGVATFYFSGNLIKSAVQNFVTKLEGSGFEASLKQLEQKGYGVWAISIKEVEPKTPAITGDVNIAAPAHGKVEIQGNVPVTVEKGQS